MINARAMPASAGLRPDDARMSTAVASRAELVHRDEWLSANVRAPGWFWVVFGAVATAALMGWALPQEPNPSTLQDRATASKATRGLSATSRDDPSIDAQLARARLQMVNGDLDIALHQLQDVLDDDPKHVAALHALVELHDRANRKADALTTLARILTIAPNQDWQRQLIARHRALGQDALALQALDALVHNFQAGSSSEHLLLADALMARQLPQRALQTLDALERRQSRAMTVDVVADQLSALLAMASADTDKASSARALDQAQTRARAWLNTHPASRNNDVTTLTAPYLRAGVPASALSLLEPLLDAQSPSIMAAWSRAMIASGRGDEALRRLATSTVTGSGVERLHQRVALALELDRLDAALAALRSHGSPPAPRSVLVTLAQAALVDQRTDTARARTRHDLLRELWLPINQAVLASADSLLAARIATAVGDGAAVARLADGAAAACHGKTECAVHLASMNHQQGRNVEAAMALTLVDQAGEVPETQLVEYARVAIATNRSQEASVKLDKQRHATASQAFNEAWLLVATAAGQHREAIAWLNVNPVGGVSDDVLSDVFKLSLQVQAHALTAAAGQRLPPTRIKPSELVLLAQAQMALNRRAESLATWRRVRTQTDAYQDEYAQALTQVVERNADATARSELVALHASTLKRAVPGPKRDAVMQQLIDLGAADQALPTLGAMALAEPQRWLAPFETAATRAGQGALLVPVWKRVVADTTVPREMRTQRALQLFDAGERVAADQALRMLVTDGLPDDAVMQRLFSHWGPRLRPDHLDWLEARALTARSAPEGDATPVRAAWMKKLNDVGAAARTVAVYRRLQDKPMQGPVFDAYVDALTQMGDRAGLAAALRRGVRATN